MFYATWVSLLPPLVAIALALITKEVYSSLFIGIVLGGLLYAGGNPLGAMIHIFQDGLVGTYDDETGLTVSGAITDPYNAGILVFLVILGVMVALLNKSGGSAAFGRWAKDHIKTRVGAQLAAIILSMMIFIDDYFACLSVGSIMKPVTDKHNVSRAKLAYVIDATAAPVCIIAPVSSWAAAVASFAEDGQGFRLFIQAIPYNYYALLTLVMMFTLVITKIDFGPMAKAERTAIETGDLFNGINPYADAADDKFNEDGRVLDLVLPIATLIISCIIGMIYTGGFFDGASIIDAFAGSDASVGLMFGSVVALIITMVYYGIRRLIGLKSIMDCVPEGFKAMVPAMLILTFAWTLKAMTDSLGAKEFVAGLVVNSAGGLQAVLPVIVFLIGCVLAFSTGTSWGTFGILIPIVQSVFPMGHPMCIVCIAACMAGAVCGDHCSPISDTTIMASAGAQCDHVQHVSTQLPYAITCAAVSAVTYLIAGLFTVIGISSMIALPIGIVLMIGTVIVIGKTSKVR